MRLAFVLYKYFPYGGLQRDFMQIALECQRRGHQICVYTPIWQADIPSGFEVHVAPILAWFSHNRNRKFSAWLAARLVDTPAERVIGFNKMPGLDWYYAADGCFAEKAQQLRAPLYQKSKRYQHFVAYERAVFAVEAATQVLMISAREQAIYVKHYQTPAARLHLLPPGINQDRRAPLDAPEIRAAFRARWQYGAEDLLVVQIGSGFKTKGLDRSVQAIAALPSELKRRTRLIVIGQDDPRPFQRQIKTLGLEKHIQILPGRDDIPEFLLSADLLVHPAYHENTGTVLLEALVSGLPVLVTEVCGYAPYIVQADCGVVLPSPFVQSQFNQTLADTLRNRAQRAVWSANGLAFAEQADLYSMPQKAADLILGRRACQ